MVRFASLCLGTSFIMLGALWFYSSLLDDILLRIAGPMTGTPVSDMSKMCLSDDLSLMIAGIAMTGVGLVVFGLYGSDSSEPMLMDEVPPAKSSTKRPVRNSHA